MLTTPIGTKMIVAERNPRKYDKAVGRSDDVVESEAEVGDTIPLVVVIV